MTTPSQVDVQAPQGIEHPEYAGFWIRTAAALIDSIFLILVTMPLLFMIYGLAYWTSDDYGFVAGPADLLISYILPAVATVMFWLYWQATPAKRLLNLHVVDAKTLRTLSTGQAIGRYLSYYPATLVFGIGLIWVAFDARKQGWHDKVAGTVVIKGKGRDGA